MKPRSRRLLQELEESRERGQISSGMMFHENSKLTPHGLEALRWRIGRLVSERLGKKLSQSYKSYPGHPQVELPRAELVHEQGLQEIIVGRRSTREFDTRRSITLPELANLLQLSYGITGKQEGQEVTQYLRALPSAGALYPLELYLVAQRVEGLAPGLYHYRVAHHALETLETADQSERMRAMGRDWGLCSTAAFYLVISGMFERTMLKYQERGYRFVLMEAGMLGHSAMLLAECQHIRSCMMGGWLDDELNRLLGLDGLSESVLHVICFGKEREVGAHA